MSLTKYFKEKALAISLNHLLWMFLRKGSENAAPNRMKKFQKRMQKAKEEIDYAKWFDEEVMNDDLEKACKEAEILVANFLDK